VVQIHCGIGSGPRQSHRLILDQLKQLAAGRVRLGGPLGDLNGQRGAYQDVDRRLIRGADAGQRPLQGTSQRGRREQRQVDQVRIGRKIVVPLLGQDVVGLVQRRDRRVGLTGNEGVGGGDRAAGKMDFIEVAGVSQPPGHQLNLQPHVAQGIEIADIDGPLGTGQALLPRLSLITEVGRHLRQEIGPTGPPKDAAVRDGGRFRREPAGQPLLRGPGDQQDSTVQLRRNGIGPKPLRQFP